MTLTKRLASIFFAIRDAGVTPHLNGDEARQTRAGNFVAICLLCLDVPDIALFFALDAPVAAFSLMFLMTCFAMTPVLASRGYRLAAKVWLLFWADFGILFFANFFGPNSGMEHLFYPAIAAPFLLFSSRQWPALAFSVAWPTFLLNVVFANYLGYVSMALPSYKLPEMLLQILWHFMTLNAVFLLAGIVWFSVRQIDRYASRLKVTIELLTTAYSLLVHDSASYLFAARSVVIALARTRSDNPEDVELMGYLNASLGRLETMLSTLRSFLKREENPEQGLNSTGSRFGDAVTVVKNLLAARGRESEAKIIIDDSILDMRVAMADQSIIHVLDNLIGNAMKALSDGDVEAPVIIIGREPVVASQALSTGGRSGVTGLAMGEYLTILVSDNAHGLSAERFESLSSTAGRARMDDLSENGDDGRRSFGLSLVRKLIEQDGGAITVSTPAILSEEIRRTAKGGPGTTFHLRLKKVG